MPTGHEAFLAAIRAAPDDDLPRLVFADRLEEHGDPDRAEFIRVQCNGPHPEPHYPGAWFSYSQHRTIDKRLSWIQPLHRLLMKMGDGWIGQPNFGSYEWSDTKDGSLWTKVGPTKFMYQRGFIARVSGPLTAFGEERGDCRACNGTGNVSGRRPAARHDAQCPECKATGGGRVWVPTPAFAELVRREPLPDDGVDTTDRRPARYDGSELRVWYRDSGDPQRRHPEQARLPDALFDSLTGWEDGGHREGRWKTFTDRTAMPALSTALVRAARRTP